MEAATLPDLDQLDSQALKSLILAQHEQVLSQREQLASRDVEIEHLKLLIAKLRRMQFGRSSEKRENQIEQLELRLEELEVRRRRETTATPGSTGSATVARPARRPLPDHLPREVRKCLPKHAACPDCGGKLKHLGEDISEILEYVPASLKVIQYVRPKLACAGCDRIVQAEAPSRPIDRGIAGPGLLAHVLVSKYCDHLPLYRQSQIYARSGVELDRSTLAEWVGGSSELLAPLVEVLRRHVLSAGKLHADDIPVPVLAPGLGKTKTGRLWTYVRDDRSAGDRTPAAVWFAYSPDRKASTHNRICATSPVHCKQMVTLALIGSTKQAAFGKRRAGRTYEESFTILRSRTNLPLRLRLWNASRSYMPSKKKSEGIHPTSGVRFATHAAGRCWNR